MLPKLQQSSLANTLRRDNLASLIQCTHLLIKVRINSKTSSANRTMKAINLGKIHTLLKILTVLSEIFPKSIYLKRNWKRLHTSLSTNWRFQDLCLNIRNRTEVEVEHRVLSKRSKSYWNLCPNQVRFKKDRWPSLSFDAITIEVIFPSKWTIRVLFPS